MSVIICLPLFGPPGRELDEGTALHSRQLRELATELQARLLKAADMVDRLRADGWAIEVAMYEALLSQKGVETEEEAAKRLQALGMSVEEFMIVEEVDEEDE